MKKVWLIAKTTYRQQVRSGGFLILTFGLPVLMMIAGAIPFFLGDGGSSLPTIGIVNENDDLTVVNQVQMDEATLTLTAFDDATAAASALQEGMIGGYLVIPPDYLEGGTPTYHADEAPNAALEGALATALRQSTLPDAPEWLPARLDNPATVTYVDGTRGAAITSGPGLIMRILIPVVLALVFGLMVFTSASQLGSAVVQEKDQRAMEIVITSLAPRQLVMGKVLGMGLLSLTQIGVWLAGGALALLLAFSRALDPEVISISWVPVIWAVLLGVPAYFLYAALAAGLGIIAGDSQQARQLAGILGFLGLAPFWLMGIIVQDPNGPLALGLTFFPLTSPMISLVRMALSTVPTWQLVVALALIVISLIVTMWAVGRIFRSAMLLYGQTLRPQAIWHALRTA
jgi:ABC-2 type transport system permease protein